MGAIAQTLTAPQGPLMGYAERLLVGVKPEQFARQPAGKSGVIDTNHPAFIFGHMSIYPAKIMDILGVEGHGIGNPDGFDELFAAGAVCKDDPDGTIYPSMESVTGHFFDGHKKMFAKIAELTDEHLAAPHGIEKEFFQNFPSRAAAAAFMVGPHPFTHIGQMSAWRRCMGMASAF